MISGEIKNYIDMKFGKLEDRINNLELDCKRVFKKNELNLVMNEKEFLSKSKHEFSSKEEMRVMMCPELYNKLANCIGYGNRSRIWTCYNDIDKRNEKRYTIDYVYSSKVVLDVEYTEINDGEDYIDIEIMIGKVD